MTTPAERDAAVERLLRTTRADAAAPGAGVCLDAESLARWSDGQLSSVELENAIAHAADCARCQALLAAMARTEAPREFQPRARFGWTLVRWGLPLSAAAALALWIAVERDAVAPTPRVAQERAAADNYSARLPGSKDSRESEARSSASAARVPPAAAPERDQLVGRRDQASTDTATANPLAAASGPPLQDAHAIASAPLPTVPAPTPPAAASAPPAEARPTAKEFPPHAQASPQQLPGGGLAETLTTTAEESARDARATALRRERQAVAPIEVPSPDPLVRWRFTMTGDVDRSTDGGVTWTRERIAGARAALVTGVAPSSSVVWLAGRDGIVLRFTAGDGWRRVPLPTRAHIVSIVASDAANATVRLAGGATRTTTDGGRTWR